MQVLKFGGSSVASASTITKVINILKEASGKDKTIFVASAISGATDKLIEIGTLAGAGNKKYEELIRELETRHTEIINKLIPADFQHEIQSQITALFDELKGICNGIYLIREISFYTTDLIMSFGELLSTKIIHAKCASLGMSCRWVDARELIKTDLSGSHNVVNTEATYRNIRKMVRANSTKIYIVPGFIATDSGGRTTTLGRGGSDYTAALLAVGAEARILEIWTDVNGMMTADPRIVTQAVTIENISYKEALELSHFGAKVVYPPTIQPVVASGIPILVKNTFNPHAAGTLIEQNPPEGNNKIKGISSSNRIALLSMEGSGMVGVPGYSSRLFDALTKQDINIILITQASSVHTMLVAIEEKEADKAKKAADEVFAYEISLNKVEPLKVECGFSIISLIGDDMKNQSGASGRMFEAIGRRNITIRAIAQGSSEKNVSAVVATADVEDAIRAVHEEFFGVPSVKVNLYIAGYGNVGKQLVNMIFEQKEVIKENKGIELNIAGISNTRTMIFDKTGLDRERIAEALGRKDIARSNDSFPDRVFECNMRNSLFVDCTGDKYIAARYAEILSNKIGIVTCNKIANASGMDYYLALRRNARNEHVPFLYETNVGAALPVISLIGQLVRSGDKISRIEASLSGTLNYVFTHYDGSVPFEQIVAQAKELGYTEPDPLTDLSGTDVLRKALILARETGLAIEEEDIKTASFLPAVWPDESHFLDLYNRASREGRKLKYLVCLENGQVNVGLQAIDETHPFFNLGNTDSALLIYSSMYPGGLKVEGAGAGAVQTASGLFNDILQTVKI